MTSYWHTRDITDRLIANRRERIERRVEIISDEIMDAMLAQGHAFPLEDYSADLLTLTPKEDWEL